MSVDLSYLGLVPDGVYFRWPTPKLVEAAVKNNEGHLLHNLAFAVRTGHTGRSPKDRFVVDDANTHDTVKWNAINQPIAEANFDAIFERIQQYVRAYSVSSCPSTNMRSMPARTSVAPAPMSATRCRCASLAPLPGRRCSCATCSLFPRMTSTAISSRSGM